MKKILALLLAMLMVIGLFAACGSKDESSSKEESSSAAEESEASEEGDSEAEEPADGETADGDRGTPDEMGVYPFGIPTVDEPITIKVCYEKATQDVGDDNNQDKWAIKKASEDTGIQIDWSMTLEQGTSGDKVPAMLVSGADLPDVFFQLIGATQILQYEDTFYPIEELEDTYASNIIANMKKVPNWEKMAVTPTGHIYSSFGFYQNLYENSMVGVQVMNTRWLENVGLEMPTDWDSYYEVLTAFKTQDANGNGDATDEIPYDWAKDMWCAHLFEQEGGRFGFTCNQYNSTSNNAWKALEVDENGTVVPVVNTDAYKEYLTVMNQMVSEGLINKEGFSGTWDTLGGDVKNDRVGTYCCWTILEYLGNDKLAEWETLERFAYPGYEDKLYQAGFKNRTTANQLVWVVTNNSQYPNAAVRYWDYLASDPKLSVATALGEQGVLWDEYENGSGLYFLVPEATDGMNFENMKYTYGFVNGAPLIPTESIPKNDPDISPDAALRDQMNAVVDKYAPDESRRIMPSYVPDEKTTELQLYEVSLMAEIDAFEAKAITEGFTDAEWDDYCASIESLGYSDMLAWYQHKYDNDWE